MKPLYKRAGSLVVLKPNGLPYEVLPSDHLWKEASALDWSAAESEPPPPEPTMATGDLFRPSPLITEDRLRAILAALGHDEAAVAKAIEAAR